MLKTDFVTIAPVPAGGELSLQVMTGRPAGGQHIKRLIVDIVANAAAVAYFDQDRVSLIDTNILPALGPFVDIDADLPAGVAFVIGYRDLALAGHATLNIGYQWEE